MQFDRAIVDRKVGRNAQLFSKAVAELDSPEERFPYLRILVSLVEKAHPEWNQTSQKEEQIAHLLDEISEGTLDRSEVIDVVRVRDDERRR